MKYLPLYFEWIKTGLIPTDGLCDFFNRESDSDEFFDLIKPTVEDMEQLFKEDLPSLWWGSEEWGQSWVFTPRRQHFILLMAAMNGELTDKNLKQYNQR